MLGERAQALAVPLVADRLGKVLNEVAAAEDVEQLEPAADRQCRHVALERAREESELTRITVCLRRVGLPVALRTIVRRLDVDPAGEHDAVEHVERLVDSVGARRHDERASTGTLDGLDVIERYECRGQLPAPPARRLGV